MGNSEPEVWVDHDYPARERKADKCPKCGDDLVLRHHCAADDGALAETIEGWFMDGRYLPDRTFWEMGAEIIDTLRENGYAIVKAT
jgi:hypothetical protein